MCPVAVGVVDATFPGEILTIDDTTSQRFVRGIDSRVDNGNAYSFTVQRVVNLGFICLVANEIGSSRGTDVSKGHHIIILSDEVNLVVGCELINDTRR